MTTAFPPAARPIGRTLPVDRRQFVLGGALLATVAASLVLKPKRIRSPLAPGMLDRAVPTTIGPYHFVSDNGLVLPPQDEITERIYDQVLTRVYQADGLPAMMLLVAYGSAQAPAHCHEASHGCRASATGEMLVKTAYIDWFATLPIVPSVSPKFVPLA